LAAHALRASRVILSSKDEMVVYRLRATPICAAPICTALICIWLAAPACAPRPASRTLTVAAAADLNFALEQASREFRSAHPEVALQIDYGSSGAFYTQLRNRAPFDMFLSADVEYPRKLAGEGIGAADSVFIYAIGRIVVWVPAGSRLDPATALRDPSVRHVAIANPRHAPYGRAAEAALRSLGLYDTVEKKLVLGENIAQTLQFVESGAAEVGIVAFSLAQAPSVRAAGRYWEIPATAYPKLEQGGIILKPSPAASEFRAFLLDATGRRVLKQFGFYLPGE
jgi:molybdate transport system substrate-binding protein